MCHCRDCRAYAHHLGQPSHVLDTTSGTEFIAAPSPDVTFTAVGQNLACLSLTEKGLLRWYAKCCNTPIANTARDWKLPYVGLAHACLAAGPDSVASSFPPIQMHLNVQEARGAPPAMGLRKFFALLGFVPRMLATKATGGYRHTPFFDQNGAPRVAVEVLSDDQRERAMRAADA